MRVVEVSGDSRFPVDRKRVRRVVKRVLASFGVDEATVSVRIVGDRKMRKLNKTYRKIDKTTDVLSFATEEGEVGAGSGFVYPSCEPLPLGDVVISYPTARDQAAERDVFVDDEIERLLVHGVKSLLGKHPGGN